MKERFITSIVKTAQTGAPRMPWERGAPRAEMIARRGTPLRVAAPAPVLKRA